MRWFTSDTHFGHKNIITYCNRPFLDAEDNPDVPAMNAGIIDRYNNAIDANDEVFWLGDVVMGKPAETLSSVAACNGEKHLIVGNHDRMFATKTNPEKNARMHALYKEEGGFSTITHGYTYITLESTNRSVMLCHFPHEGDHTETDRYADQRPPKNSGTWTLCGHVHDLWKQQGSTINVGVDAWGGIPVSETMVEELISAGPANRPPDPWHNI